MNPLLTTGMPAQRGTALSVNVNKVALLRNTRELGIPSVVRAATVALEAGVVVEGEIDGATLIGVQAALQHGSFAALQQACRPALPELRTALRAWIQHQLGHATLRTRQVMRDVQTL